MLNVQDTFKIYNAIINSSKNNADEFMVTSTGQQVAVLNRKNDVASYLTINLNNRQVALETYETNEGLAEFQIIRLVERVDLMIARL